MLQIRSLGSAKLISINKNKLIEKLEEIACFVKEANPQVEDIKLFGSIAKGEDTGGSDADILIIVESSKESILKRILRYKKYFEIPIAVDVFVYTESEIKKMLEEGNSFLKDALHYGISLLKTPESLRH